MPLKGLASHLDFTLVGLHSDVAAGNGAWVSSSPQPTPEHVAKPQGRGEDWLSLGREPASFFLLCSLSCDHGLPPAPQAVP